MSDLDPLIVAVEARSSAAEAHRRLDRMNGSLDRLTGEVAKSNAASVEILRRLDREEGVEAGASRTAGAFWENGRWVVGVMAVVFSSSLVALLFEWVFRAHP